MDRCIKGKPLLIPCLMPGALIGSMFLSIATPDVRIGCVSIKERFKFVRLAGRWRGLHESEINQTLNQIGLKKGKGMFLLKKSKNHFNLLCIFYPYC